VVISRILSAGSTLGDRKSSGVILRQVKLDECWGCCSVGGGRVRANKCKGVKGEERKRPKAGGLVG